MKWYVDGHEFNEASEAAAYILENCSEDYYDDYLNEAYGEIDVCGYTYLAAGVLYDVDPTAYHCGRSDWEDAMSYDLTDELESMCDGESSEWYGATVLCEEDEEEEDEEE